MTDSLRDQLLGLGFKPAPKPERKPESKADRRADAQRRAGPPPGKAGKGNDHKPKRENRSPSPPRSTSERSREGIDLAKAYAIRAQKEKDERIAAERQKQEEARLRREAKAKVEALLTGKALNDAQADIARHFPYGGKIKRIHVNAEQLKALNAGELGVIQQNGRYLLVTREVLAEAEALFPACVALKVDPDVQAEDDPYSDPQYQVPDDLVW